MALICLASAVNFERLMVSNGDAMRRSTSDRARPSVFVPRSMPRRRAPGQGAEASTEQVPACGFMVSRPCSPSLADRGRDRACSVAERSFALSRAHHRRRARHEDHLVRPFRLSPRFRDKVVLIDPFFTGNPAFDGDRAKAVGRRRPTSSSPTATAIMSATPLDIADKTGAKVVTNYDLCMWLASKGLENFDPMNTGGTTDQGGFTVTLVRADHSAAMVEAGVDVPARQSERRHRQGAGRAHRLSHGRHGHFRRHGADRRDSTRRRSLIVPIGDRFTMGAGRRRRWRSSASSSRRPSFRAITARFRSSSRTPTSSSRRWKAAACRSSCRTSIRRCGFNNFGAA